MRKEGKKLNWKALLTDTCPKCGSPFDFKDTGVYCSMYGREDQFFCDFVIQQDGMNDLKHKMRDRNALDTFSHDNQQSLNNL
jgi:uncharacterized Zn finger protein (UPF0148 family)